MPHRIDHETEDNHAHRTDADRLYGRQDNLLAALAFTELKVKAGVTDSDVRLDAPAGTRKITVTADVSDPEWERKMEAELRALMKLGGAEERIP